MPLWIFSYPGTDQKVIVMRTIKEKLVEIIGDWIDELVELDNFPFYYSINSQEIEMLSKDIIRYLPINHNECLACGEGLLEPFHLCNECIEKINEAGIDPIKFISIHLQAKKRD